MSFYHLPFYNIQRMPKKINKKSTKKSATKKQAIKKSKEKSKLGAGKKQCKSCGVIMPIHRKVCTDCGHSHETRKNKEHIMKRINKMTPILVKSIIQNNDFNQFKPWSEDIIFDIGQMTRVKTEVNEPKTDEKYDAKNLKVLPRRKSHQAQKSEPVEIPSVKHAFKQANLECFEYIKFEKAVSCVASSKDWVVVAENVYKSPVGLQKNNELTTQAFNLEQFTLVGLSYVGETNIHFCYAPPKDTDPKTYRFDLIKMKRCIISMKIYSNLLGMLTGQSSVVFVSLEKPQKNSADTIYSLSKSVEIFETLPDRITCFEFLRSTAHKSHQQIGQEGPPEIQIAVGTLYGQISIYKLVDQGHSLVRFISNAHMEMVTTISECPLNSTQEVMFASGSYDGNVSVWSLYEKSPVFSFECSNRKIWSVSWDPGCKFLFINRDQMSETCVIICFYSINKIETAVNISDTIQTRTVKTNINATMVHQNYYSKFLPVLDSVNGIFKLLQLQDLRGSSLKKKKPKKQDGAEKYFKILPLSSENVSALTFQIEQIIEGDEQIHEKLGTSKLAVGEMKKFPLFSSMTIQSKDDAQFIYFSTYSGGLLVYKHLLKKQ